MILGSAGPRSAKIFHAELFLQSPGTANRYEVIGSHCKRVECLKE